MCIAMARPTPPPLPVTIAVRSAMKLDQSRIIVGRSDLEHDRDDGRPPLRLLVDELAECAARAAAHGLEVGPALLGGVLDRLADRVAGLLEERLRLRGVGPALCDDLGAAHDLAGAHVDGHEDDDHAL